MFSHLAISKLFGIAAAASFAVALALIPKMSTGETSNDPNLNQLPQGFVKLGTPLADWRGKLEISEFKRFQAAEENIAVAADCLSISESDKIPSHSKLDWDKIQNMEDLEVCLFRVASYLRSPEEISVWLDFNGFISVETIDVFDTAMKRKGRGRHGIAVLAVMKGENLPSQIAGWIWFLRPYTLSLSIALFDDGSLFDVVVGNNYK
jgi:hypothetical protein